MTVQVVDSLHYTQPAGGGREGGVVLLAPGTSYQLATNREGRASYSLAGGNNKVVSVSRRGLVTAAEGEAVVVARVVEEGGRCSRCRSWWRSGRSPT